ncbi:hypothetical protein AKJ16_DCAP24466 [Drosera capensis]
MASKVDGWSVLILLIQILLDFSCYHQQFYSKKTGDPTSMVARFWCKREDAYSMESGLCPLDNDEMLVAHLWKVRSGDALVVFAEIIGSPLMVVSPKGYSFLGSIILNLLVPKKLLFNEFDTGVEEDDDRVDNSEGDGVDKNEGDGVDESDPNMVGESDGDERSDSDDIDGSSLPSWVDDDQSDEEGIPRYIQVQHYSFSSPPNSITLDLPAFIPQTIRVPLGGPRKERRRVNGEPRNDQNRARKQ